MEKQLPFPFPLTNLKPKIWLFSPGKINAIIQYSLSEKEKNQLAKEFPNLNFLFFPRMSLDIPEEAWKTANILFSEGLAKENLDLAPDLRWIHTPTPNMQRLCLKEIKSKGTILISSTPETNTFQIGEYVLSVILAFAKNLFQWKTADQLPSLLWDCKWRNSMWSLKDKIFLQIGLQETGISIAKRAKLSGMKVWGVEELSSTFPFCDKNFSYSALKELLPKVDVVSLTVPYGKEWSLKREELSLMKTYSILSVIGSSHHIDEDALYELATLGKFKGILLDAYYQTRVPPQSKLWRIPQLLLTPGVAPRPKAQDRVAFKIFRFNLRQFLCGNFSDMQHLIDPSLRESTYI